ncbi:phosphodiesterase [Saccharothrix saharensis]|uniref:phosphodiesterase n=1 Tax=Saccharothrix saharensis TaxID=571190 RepID=UPI001FE32A74|nr:phosphodiesterase [Saccharothrix saharensis]
MVGVEDWSGHVLIAHLSDPHLRTDALAAEPAALLRLALGRVLAVDPRPDCVVITGDLVEHGRVEAYAQLRELVGAFPLPLHLVTGNHDDPAALVEVFRGTGLLGGGESAHYAVDHEGFTVVALDSWRPDGPAGLVGEEQLAWLDDVLGRRPDVPAFVCLHHPPVAVGIPLLDGMRLEDGPALGEVLGKHGNVARVLAGHVHRAISVPFAGTVVSVAPSTYRQTSLTLRADRQTGHLAEPTGFLLHVATESGFATHTVAVSQAWALSGTF